MTAKQFERLKRYNWKASQTNFDSVKNLKPKDDVERFYKFYFLRWCSFEAGSKQFSKYRDGEMKDITRLWRVSERLKRTAVYSADATSLISKYDNPDTFYYLDPPYPRRAFIGQSFKDWTEEDLKKLVAKLQHIKGKFALSLGTEHTKFLPKNWHISRVKVWRRIPAGGGEFNQTYQYEIIATNYDPTKELTRPHVEMVPVKLGQHKEPGNGHKRVPVGVFSDKRGERLSRRYHRGWKRLRYN